MPGKEPRGTTDVPSELPGAAASPPPPKALWRRLPWREVLLFIVVFAAVQLWQTRDMTTGAMPALAGPLASGGAGSLAATQAQANGRPVLVYLWASWCPICRLEEATVGALAQDWPLLTIAMQSGNAIEVAHFMAQRDIHYPTLIDEHGTLAAQLGVRSVPAWFVVDSQQRIRFAGSGYSSGWGLRLRLWWAGAWA